VALLSQLPTKPAHTKTSDGAEIAAVWLQDWAGQRTTDFGERVWWTWQLDRERYPGWEQLVADLAQQGIAVTTYVNPFIVDAGPKGDDTIRNLYDGAREAGYLVAQAGGSAYLLDQGGIDAALVDLSNAEARDWFADVIAEEVLGVGVSGFMADFGEGLPFDAEIARGNPRLVHNAWPRLWAQTVREACDRAGEDECLTWFRSGSLGMGEDASLFWNGDQLVDFGQSDGLASACASTPRPPFRRPSS
jgi:alpha-glucosidase